MTYLLGIDQGTTQTTAVVVDNDGQVVDSCSVRLPIQFPEPGRVEQDPGEILRTVREATAPLLDKYEIHAAGFDNQGETFILWEAATGRPVTPAIVWQDKRGAAVCEALAGNVDLAWLQRKTGLLLDSYFTAPKLAYVLQQQPELAQRAQDGELRFGTTESWVLWQLSDGRLHVTDPSTAARTLLFDINTGQWDPELLALFGVPEVLLPTVVPSAGYVGEVDFGNGRPLPLYALLVDQTAALFGQACFLPGEMKCTFGTGSFLLMNTGNSPQLSDAGLITTVAWRIGDESCYALDGGIFVAGAAVQWVAEGLGLFETVAETDAAAHTSTEQELLFVPALSGLAAPHWRTDVRGAMFGLTRATTPADIARATLDGIAYRVVEVVDAMSRTAGLTPTTLKVDGGPTANTYLMQFLADLAGIEVHVAAAREATAIGVANLAAHAAFGTSLESLAERWSVETVYRPRMGTAERQTRLDRWVRALRALQQFHDPAGDAS